MSRDDEAPKDLNERDEAKRLNAAKLSLNQKIEASAARPTGQKSPKGQQAVPSPSILGVDVISEVHDTCLEVDASPTDCTDPVVTVIGGGITGLSAAHELIQRGFRVQVVESEARQLPHLRRPRRRDSTRVGGLAANQYGRVPAAPQILHPYYYRASRQHYLDTLFLTGEMLNDKIVANGLAWSDQNVADYLPLNTPKLYDVLDLGAYIGRDLVEDDRVKAAVKALDHHEMEPLGKIYPTPWRLSCDHLELLALVEQLSRLWSSIGAELAPFAPQGLVDDWADLDNGLTELSQAVNGLDTRDETAVQNAGDQMVTVWKRGLKVRDYDELKAPEFADRLKEACDIEIQLVDELQEITTALANTFAVIRDAYHHYRKQLRARYDECLELSFDDFAATAIGAREILVVEIIGRVTQTGKLWKDQKKAFKCAQETARRLLEMNIAAGNPIPELRHHLVIRGEVLPPGRARQRRSLVRANSHVVFRILERHVAGEHGYRFFPNFYRHLFDIMKSTPILDEYDRETPESAFDQLESVELFNVAQKGKPLTTINRSMPRSYQQAQAQWDAFANFGATLDDMTRSGARALKYFTSGSARREKEYEDISWWDFMGGVENYSPQYLQAMDQLLRATNSMRPSESDARSFGDSFVQLSLGWANPDAEKDMTLNGPTSEAWLEPWKRFLVRQGVHFYRGRIVGFDGREGDDGPCKDQELLPRWGVFYLQGYDPYNPEDEQAVLTLLKKALDDEFPNNRIPFFAGTSRFRRVLRNIEPQLKELPYEKLSFHLDAQEVRERIRGRTKKPALRRLLGWLKEWDEQRAHRALSLQKFNHHADFYILATPVQVTAALIRDYGDSALEGSRERWFDDFETHDDRRVADRLPESLREHYDRERWETRLREFEQRVHHHEAEVLDVDFLSMYRFDRVGDLAWPTALADRDRNGRPKQYATHPYREINGIQYFYETNFTIGKYHVFYLNSPWAISSLSPQRYWRTKFNRQNAFLAEVTADIGGFYSPGAVSTSKTAWQSSKFELANEIYAQIAAGLNADFHYTPAKGWQGTPIPNYYYVDHALRYIEKDTCLVRNNMPFLINLPGQWRYRPGLQFGRADVSAQRVIKYEVSHLRWVLAGTYMATHTRMTTMESAAESARHAVNAVLLRLRQSQAVRIEDNPGGYRGAGRNMGNDCEIYPLEEYELPELESLRDLDDALARRGLPHFLDILGVIEYIDTHREPFASAIDGIGMFTNRLETVSEDFYVNEALRQQRDGGDKHAIGALLQAYQQGVFQPAGDMMKPILETLKASPFGSIDDVVKKLSQIWKLLGTGGDSQGM